MRRSAAREVAGATLDASALIAIVRGDPPLRALLDEAEARAAGTLCGRAGTADVIDACFIADPRTRGPAGTR